MTTPSRTHSAGILAAVAMALCGASLSQAEVVLTTDFAGRTISGKTAMNISWTVNGIQDPGDLTWVVEGGGPTTTALFDTANAQGHFAPDLNIGNEGPWSVTIPLTLTAAQIALENVVIDWQHFTNTGGFQGPARSADWTVSVTGSVSGPLETITATAVSGTSGMETLTFPSPLNLTSAESYDVKIFVAGTNATGNNTGLKGVTLNGVVNNTVDTTAPAIASLSPDSGAAEVPPLANLVITFDEVVRTGAGNIVIRQSSDDAEVETFEVTSANVTINGAEVTIDPAANLAGLSGFYVEIDRGAILDFAGNEFAGITGAEAWSFTTAEADTTAPTVLSLSPANGATGVSRGTNLVLTFDEVVETGAGTIEIRQSGDDSAVETIDVTSAIVTVNGTEVTVNPVTSLAGDTSYYVLVEPGALQDPSGNPFDGIDDNSTWNFTTAAIILATDFTGRTVNGKTAENITWTTNGVADPGSLTWMPEGGGPLDTGLFDTPGAQGYFAPDLNIDNEGPWSTTITLVPTVSQILLEEVAIGWQHFNNGGTFQTADRAADWTVSVTGSASGELASVTAPNVNGISGLETLVFTPPLTLTRAETYDVKIFVTGNGPGNNTGLDAITLGGKVGPAAPFHFDVTGDGANLDLEWESRAGMFYVLRSSTDLAAELSTWESVNVPGSVENDGVFEIAHTAPLNAHTILRPGDPTRFYRVEEIPLPPVTVLEETFDTTTAGNLPAGWTTGFDPADILMATNWELGDPFGGPPSGPAAAQSGANCVGTNLAADYGTESTTWLRTAPIDLSTATGATVTFQHWVDIDDLDNLDRGTVRVLDASTLPGAVTELGVVAMNINGLNFEFENWVEFSANLPAEALGQSVVLEFGFVSDADGSFDASGWYLDDVVVTTPAP